MRNKEKKNRDSKKIKQKRSNMRRRIRSKEKPEEKKSKKVAATPHTIRTFAHAHKTPSQSQALPSLPKIFIPDTKIGRKGERKVTNMEIGRKERQKKIRGKWSK